MLKNIYYYCLYIFFLLSITQFSSASPVDSVGLEVINGKVYLLHKVKKKETVYSIALKYNVSMLSIVQSSPEVKRGLITGMIIRVPYITREKSFAKKYHTVKVNETLHAIGKMYALSVDRLMQLNNLNSTIVYIGQELRISDPSILPEKTTPSYRNETKLHVVLEGESLYGIARDYSTAIDSIMKWNYLKTTLLYNGQQLITSVAKNNTDFPHQPLYSDLLKNRVVESGLAATIDDSESTNKYLALHRYVDKGTLIAVRNEMNDQMVYVRIVGKLPNIGVNTNVVIRLSKLASKKLGAIDSKFRVQLSYLSQ